jgi:3-methylcrotonyl-CoA carboxylase alpha subunit
MIAKLIVWAADRQGAINKLKQALQQTHITGLTTNVRYLEQLISLPSFADAGIETDLEHSNLEIKGFDTGFIEKNSNAIAEASILSEHNQRLHQILCAYYLYQQRQRINTGTNSDNRIQSNDQHSPWKSTLGWRLNAGYEDPLEFYLAESDPSKELALTAQFQQLPSGKQLLLMAGQQYQIESLTNSTSHYETQTLSLHIKSIDIETQAFDCHIKAQVLKHNKQIQVHNNAGTSLFTPTPRLSHNQTEEQNEQGLHAPMNGCLTEVKVTAGDVVNSGDILVIMEAMKMEHIIKAPHDGIIDQVFFVQGDLVDEGSELLSYDK